MREMIKKIIMELLPELAGGLHLDRYARVLAAGDAPTEGATSERFRPRYAVDLEILGPDMEPDKNFPRYSAVPLPVSVGGGQESGSIHGGSMQKRRRCKCKHNATDPARGLHAWEWRHAGTGACLTGDWRTP